MKKIALILTLILLVFFVFLSKEEQKPVSEESEVTVEVKPLVLEKTKEAVFEVSLDTHSVELNYDLVKISRLTTGNKTLKPISWDGGSGGHHLSGKLTFPQIPVDTKNVELFIEKIEGTDQSFRWEL